MSFRTHWIPRILSVLLFCTLAGGIWGCGGGGQGSDGDLGGIKGSDLPTGGVAGDSTQVPVFVRRTWAEMAEQTANTEPVDPLEPPRLGDPIDRRAEPTGDEADVPAPRDPESLGGNFLQKASVVGGGSQPLVSQTNGFEALPQQGGTIPPDTHGAVGPNHLVSLMNTQMRVQDKFGNVVAPDVGLGVFFGSTGHTDIFDPRILYDNLANRWVACADASRVSSRSSIVFAISATSDPTGSWTFYSIDADARNTRWADYPGFGYNDVWYAITNNMFQICGTRNTATATALNAAAVTAGNGDDGYWTVPMGINFPFFGSNYTTANIGTNGYVTFGGGNSNFDVTFPAPTPFNGMNPVVAGIMDDLVPSSGGTVWYESLSDRFVVTWDAVPVFGAGGVTRSFQIQLLNNGQIHVSYAFGPTNPGTSATTTADQAVGISPGGTPTYTNLDYTAATPATSPAGNAVLELFGTNYAPLDLEPGCLIYEPDGAGGYRIAYGPPDPSGTGMKVIDRSTALAGGLLTVTDFAPGYDNDPNFGFNGFTTKPTVHRTPGTTTMYLLNSGFVDLGGTKFHRLGRLTGTGPAPVYSSPGGIHPGTGTFASGFAWDFSVPNNPQLGGTPVDAGDTRLSGEPMLRTIGGAVHIYFAHSGGTPAGAPTQPACFAQEIDPALMPAPVLRNFGFFFGGTDGGPSYPSIAANSQNDILLGYSHCDSTIYPAAAVSRIDPANPGPLPDVSQIVKSGEAEYSIFFGGARNRWGDYSATMVDPTDEMTIWTVQEFADTPEPGFTWEGSRWSTWWSRWSPFGPMSLSTTLTYSTNTVGGTAGPIGIDCAMPLDGTGVPAVSVNAECTSPSGSTITLDYSASLPSGAPFTVELRVDGVVVDSANAAGQVPGPSMIAGQFMYTLPDGGPYVVQVVADDGSGDRDICGVNVTVLDTTPPQITCPPNVGPLECTGPTGAEATWADPIVTDACDPNPSLQCVVTVSPNPGVLPVGTVVTSPYTFPLGVTQITCTATDAAGNTGSCAFTVTVQDTTPPTVTALIQRPYLFLPRNALLDTLLSYSATDLCDPMPAISVEVWSNQPDDATYTPDAQVVGSAVWARAQVDLASAVPGRVYLIIVSATDMSGNVGRDCAWAIVPKTVTVQDVLGARNIATAAEADCDSMGTIPAGWTQVLAPTPLP